ncbi:MAG: DUF2911 domain-containing protein [Acidobacteriia bacterium]|nr:DUF2911 domain-containing protein [Terriglobia bacterium]
MRRSTLLVIATCVLTFFIALAATAQMAHDKSKRPSPPGAATFAFADGKTITIDYSRPKINDPQSGKPRVIYGGLVPYGEVWRAGANEATSFVTQANLLIGGTPVPAGSYTLFILPQQSGPWKLIVSKKTGEWGIPYPGEQYDLARFNMKADKLAAPMQQLTISFEQRGAKAGLLKLEWENTSASVEFSEANH